MGSIPPSSHSSHPTLFLGSHSIAATKVQQVDNLRETVHRLGLEACPSLRDLPQTVIVKQQKDGWQKEFQQEQKAYTRLQTLQGIVIPTFWGQGSFNGRPALILSEIVGVTLQDLTRSKASVDEEALHGHLLDAMKALYDHGAKYWDERLDNFMFCDNDGAGDKSKVMIVDLEEVNFPEDRGWGEYQVWDKSMNRATARSLMGTFRRRRSHWMCEDARS